MTALAGGLLEPFFLSTGLVALGEMGGSTQLLAMLLGARFRRPAPLLLGILLATLVNHALAGTLGWTLARYMAHSAVAGAAGIAFIAIAVWTLMPQASGEPAAQGSERFGAFGTTVLAMLAAEVGDRSQIAAVALAARFHELVPVVAGTTSGMLLADVPAVLFGARILRQLPGGLLRTVVALLFAATGVLTLMRA